MLKKIVYSAIIALMANASVIPITHGGMLFRGNVKLKYYRESNLNYNREYKTEFNLKGILESDMTHRFIVGFRAVSDIQDSNGAMNSNITNQWLYLNGNYKNFVYNIGKIPFPTAITGKGYGEANGIGIEAVWHKFNSPYYLIGGYASNITNTDLVDMTGSNLQILAFVYKKNTQSLEGWYFNAKNKIANEYVVRYQYTPVINGAQNTIIKIDWARGNGQLHGNKQKYFNLELIGQKNGNSVVFGMAKTGANGGYVALDKDSPLNSIFYTQQITGITDTSNTTAYYMGVKNKINEKTSLMLGYTFTNNKNNNNIQREYAATINYQYNKSLRVSGYYSILNQTNANDNNELNFEISYNF